MALKLLPLLAIYSLLLLIITASIAILLSAPLVKLMAIGLAIWLMALALARAEFCRSIEGAKICILDIKRSAKNYWQYQALVSVDGITKSRASYDCIERLITDPDGNLSSFRSHPEGKFVCSLYRRGS